MSDIDIYIDEKGDVQFVYSDDAASLFEGEQAETRRASHVEPHPTRPGWLADLRPVGGPVLGHGWQRTPEAMAWSLEHEGNDGVASLPPFPTRAEALAAELKWLGERMTEGALRPAGETTGRSDGE